MADYNKNNSPCYFHACNDKPESVIIFKSSSPCCLKSIFANENLVYVLFFWLGISALLPWVSFITSAGYFQTRFCDSAIENSFLSFFSVAYNLTNAITQALLLQNYERLVPYLRLRVIGSLVVMLAICVLTTVCALLPDLSAMILFSITLVSLAACGALVACFSGGIFAILGTYPPGLTQAFVVGQGLAGCGVSVVSFITIALGKQDKFFCNDEEEDDDDECGSELDYSAIAFFTTCCLVVVLAIICYWVLDTLPSTGHFRDEAFRDQTNSSSHEATESLLHDHHRLEHNEHINGVENDEDPIDISSHKFSPHSKYYHVYQQIKVPAWSVFFTFVITLSLFPAITVLIISEHQCEENGSRVYNDLFIPLFVFLFNIFDFLGRLFARQVTVWITPSNIWIPSFLRIAFYPLIMLCNIDDTVLPVAFKNDILAMLIVSAFGLSNGLLVSVAMMSGPGLVSPRHSSLAATIMLFALTTGLCCGSFLSFVTLYICQGSF